MKMVGNEFENAVNYLFRSWLPAKDIVAEAIKERFKVQVAVVPLKALLLG